MSLIITVYNAVTETAVLHTYYNNCEAGRYMDSNVYKGSFKTVHNRVFRFNAGIWSGKYREYKQS